MLCISHLDYSNDPLYVLPNKTVKRYQIIQNICAKPVLGRSKYSSSTGALKCLHWLPIEQRITHKIGLLTLKCNNNVAPKYLQELITIKKLIWENMHSNNTGPTLEIPKVKLKTFAARPFQYSAPVCSDNLLHNNSTMKVRTGWKLMWS